MKLRSLFKKIVIGIIATFTCIVLLFSIAWASLQTDYAQTRAINFFAYLLSSSFKSKVTIGSISIAFFNKIVLEDVEVYSLKNEKIASIKKLSAGLTHFSYKKRTVSLGRVYLDNAFFNLHQYKDGETNIDEWLNLKSTDTSSSKWQFIVKSLQLDKSQFSFHHDGVISEPDVFDYENTDVTGINGVVDNIKFQDKIIICDVQDLQFKERCGFNLLSLNSHFEVSSKTIVFNDLNAQTDKSTIETRFGYLRYVNFDAFKDYVNKVTMKCKVVKSKVSMDDISCFTKELKGLHQIVDAKGTFKGTVNDFVVTDASLMLLDSTTFQGRVEITGLPDIKNTYFFIDVKKLKTSMNDIASIPLYPFIEGKKVPIDPMLKKLGSIRYSGNFTGYFNDVVAFGNFSTSLGNVKSDILIKQLKHEKELKLSGSFSADNFNIGSIIGPASKIGRTSLAMKINTTFDNNGYKSSDMNGTISSIEFNKYRYQNITFNGIITPKAFNGQVDIKDRNLDMNFLGTCDLSKKIPIFDFDARVGHLNFHRLNFFKGDSIADISFKLKTNLTGNKIDNMNGFISVDSVLFENKRGQSYMENARLEIVNLGSQADYRLKSNIVDAHINGNFKVSNLLSNLTKSIEAYLPSLFDKTKEKERVEDGTVNWDIKVKDVSELSKTLFPTIKLKKQVEIVGKFVSKQNLFVCRSNVPSIEIGSVIISNFNFDLQSINSKLVYKTNFDMPVFSVGFKNITANGEIENDSITFNCNWLKDDSTVYRGFTKSVGVISRNSLNDMNARFTIFPSDIIIADSLWKIGKASITVDSTIAVAGFMFSNKEQKLSINGIISNDPLDSISLVLSNFELKYFNKFIKDKSLGMEGNLNGYLSLFQISNNFHFHSQIKAIDFHIAGADYGTLFALCEWDEANKNVGINLYTERGTVRPIDLRGFYFPDDNIIDLNLEINNASFSIISIFVKDFFSDLKGYLNGQVRIQGKLNKPEMHGYVDLKKTSLFVDYLNTRYNLSGRCNVLGQQLLFDNIQVFDAEGNPAVTTGDLTFTNFNTLTYNIVVDAKNFISLDTKLTNNPYFYGKAYATGITKIYGDLNHTQIDVSAKSNQNTIINIPINNQTTIENNTFLTFKTKNKKIIKPVEESSFDGVTMNFDLEVTPDAEMQIILDEKVGDIIRSKGNGTILMNIDTKGKFNMYGTYEIFAGDYLFTMRNLINKKFLIEPGSKLTWTGSPLEATANITAKYRIKTTLFPLMKTVNDTANPVYKQRIPIECRILLTDKIFTPNIAFNVDMKDADEKAKEVYNNLSEDEKNKQFMALLMLGGFFFDYSSQETSLYSSSTELLTSQLSNLLSNINKDVNFGVNYMYGSPTTNKNGELEVRMSTELLKNRVIVNVSGYSGSRSNTNTTTTDNSALGGDVNVEVKLNKKGTLRAKGFSRSNAENLENRGSTQGVGLSYSQNFNTFKQLFTLNRKKVVPETAKQ